MSSERTGRRGSQASATDTCANVNSRHLTGGGIFRSNRVMRIVLLALSFAPGLAFADCPPLPDRSARHSELMDLVAQAPNEMAAQELNNELWGIWATAPDETAQQILQRGMERRASYDFAGALEDFNALVDYCPHYAEGYNQRAFVNFLTGEHEISLIDLDRTLAITPDHIGALSGRALVLMELGRMAEGQTALREALTRNPWLPERNRLLPADKAPTENSSQTEL